MYAIEKNKPIPNEIRGTGAPSKYPFKKMEVGDSFTFDVDAVKVSNVAQAARSYAARSGLSFKVVIAVKNATGTCWRVE